MKNYWQRHLNGTLRFEKKGLVEGVRTQKGVKDKGERIKKSVCKEALSLQRYRGQGP